MFQLVQHITPPSSLILNVSLFHNGIFSIYVANTLTFIPKYAIIYTLGYAPIIPTNPEH